MNHDEFYRIWFHTRRPDCKLYLRGSEVPKSVSYAYVGRERSSHRGIKNQTQLRELSALSVSQDFLDEIGHLRELEYLEIPKFFTAKDLGPLLNLQKLRILKISSPHRITDLTPILELRSLERLFIENASKMTDLEWLRPLKTQLKVLGVEGSMWTRQEIPSLSPLDGFGLEALFLTSTRLGDKSLAPLRSMHSLRYLGTALNAPRSEFRALQKALPDLECNAFHDSAWEA
ncbi:leucine-rich repeat domain-containing protein [Erythrobacter mangrovi]|uniref:Leucine-rich repeat domain-containing protein n=1 Tax=Erythrobacter mangrovi TaxID=2739433 RepID=A0A7D3X9H1_9SPHN|nr:hypothetical protein [Erythrobacter mangrovi]QKG70070.1 hypothetical protein HQR01_01045 [Erythrobacter mangrovi]